MLLSLLLACPHAVDITLSAAEIAPATADGKAWDGPDSLPPQTKGVLDSVLSNVDPSGQLAAAVTGAASQLVQPDAHGRLEFRSDADAAPIVLKLPEQADTLTPAWNDAATLRGVMLSGKSSLRVLLNDQDVSGDDLIGVATLSASDLTRAELSEAPMVFEVADQTSGQVKSVTVRVVPSKQD